MAEFDGICNVNRSCAGKKLRGTRREEVKRGRKTLIIGCDHRRHKRPREREKRKEKKREEKHTNTDRYATKINHGLLCFVVRKRRKSRNEGTNEDLRKEERERERNQTSQKKKITENAQHQRR